MQQCHVINIDIQDTHEEATIGAFLMCELMQNLSNSSDLDEDIDELLQEFIYYLKLEAGAILISFRCLISLHHSRLPTTKAGQV